MPFDLFDQDTVQSIIPSMHFFLNIQRDRHQENSTDLRRLLRRVAPLGPLWWVTLLGWVSRLGGLGVAHVGVVWVVALGHLGGWVTAGVVGVGSPPLAGGRGTSWCRGPGVTSTWGGQHKH